MSFDLTIQDIRITLTGITKNGKETRGTDTGLAYSMSPAPNWKHQAFGSNFVYFFKDALLKKNSCNCVVLYEAGWIVSEDTVIRPDVMIVCEPIQKEHVTRPLVLTLEILSPSSILKDRNTKFNLYQAYGIRYYLIAIVEKKRNGNFSIER